MDTAARRVTVVLAVRRVEASLCVRYVVRHAGPDAIWVMDRWWNPATGRVDPGWMNVALVDGVAVMSRGLLHVPAGMMVSEPVVPYGRVVAPGEPSVTEVLLPLPLRAAAPYGTLEEDPARAVPVTVQALDLHVGWCAARRWDGPAGGGTPPVVVDGETLHWLDYDTAARVQHVATSDRVWLTLPALADPAPTEAGP